MEGREATRTRGVGQGGMVEGGEGTRTRGVGQGGRVEGWEGTRRWVHRVLGGCYAYFKAQVDPPGGDVILAEEELLQIG